MRGSGSTAGPGRLVGLLLGAILVWSGATAASDGPSPADVAAIARVIEAQVAAFHRDDAEGAFAFAAPAIAQRFGSAQRFMHMIRASYAPLYRARRLIFGEARFSGLNLAQEVTVEGAFGRMFLAHYLMERQPDGSWRIAGCVLTALSEDEAT